MQKIIFYLTYLPLRTYAKFAPPKDALVFLFNIHKRVLTLISDRASDYGGGVHPKHRLMKYHRFFTERLVPGEKVLDIGSGRGFLSFKMAEVGAHVTGIELSKKNIDISKGFYKNPNLTFIHGDALKDLPSGHFDTAVMSNVLEHIDDRVGFLKKAQSAAHPSRWLIRVPCFDRDWIVPLVAELGVDSRLDETHFTEFTRESFEKEMAEAGLMIEHLEVRWGEIWSELTPIQR
ncbi:MAG: class I SAM-dependent methyltransferase [bacterium]|nr:class I SAM-dependent methyltransferase [bacterium]